MFLAPWIIGFLVFTAGPMVASLVLSFTDYSLSSSRRGVGASNYAQLFDDPRVVKSLANTFIYAALFVPLARSCLAGARHAAGAGRARRPASSARPSTCR